MKCKSCVYRSSLGNGEIFCGYILKTRVRRQCEPGENCTKYKKGARMKPIDLGAEHTLWRGYK